MMEINLNNNTIENYKENGCEKGRNYTMKWIAGFQNCNNYTTTKTTWLKKYFSPMFYENTQPNNILLHYLCVN